jgi:hypothetical protein
LQVPGRTWVFMVSIPGGGGAWAPPCLLWLNVSPPIYIYKSIWPVKSVRFRFCPFRPYTYIYIYIYILIPLVLPRSGENLLFGGWALMTSWPLMTVHDGISCGVSTWTDRVLDCFDSWGGRARFPLSCYGSVVFSDPPALPWSGEALFLVAGL